MRSARFGPMPPTSVRRSGLASMISKVASPKSGHDALGHGRSDAAHVAGGEVLLDPLSTRGRGGRQHLGLELQAVLAVGEPDAGGGDPLACADGRRVSDEGDEVALAARLHLQDGKAGLGVVERDALDRARQRLSGRGHGRDGVGALAIRRPQRGLLRAGAARDHVDPVRHHEGRVEADPELADELGALRPVLGAVPQKPGCRTGHRCRGPRSSSWLMPMPLSSTVRRRLAASLIRVIRALGSSPR